MTTIALDKVKNRIAELSRAFGEGRQKEAVAVEDGGRTTMVLISLDEYESLTETAEVASDGALLDGLRRSAADVQAGRVVDERTAWDRLGW